MALQHYSTSARSSTDLPGVEHTDRQKRIRVVRAVPAKMLPERRIRYTPLDVTYSDVIPLQGVDHAPTNK